MSASEDTGPQRRVDCEIPHRLGRRTKHLPNRRVLKTFFVFQHENYKSEKALTKIVYLKTFKEMSN